MGRAKLNMELIQKEKSRNNTFKKRKEGLIRKMHEFTTLCDVSACLIIYGPKLDKNGGGAQPEIWPPNPDEVARIIDIYKAKSKDSGNKTFGLSDFFQDRKRKIEEELAKLRKKNMEAKYPTWLEFMNALSEPQLRQFAAGLTDRAAEVKSRIDVLRRSREGLGMNGMDFPHAPLAQLHFMNFYAPPPPLPPQPAIRSFEQDFINQQVAAISAKPIGMHFPFHYPPVATAAMDHHQNFGVMLQMNNDGHSVQFAAGPSGRFYIE